MKLVLSFALLLLALPVLAAPVSSSKVDAGVLEAIQQKIPKAKLGQMSAGALDGTGATYLAAIVYDDGWPGVALLRQENDAWRLLTVSSGWPSGRTAWSVKIAASTILLSDYSSGGCCSYGTSVFKFQKRGADFPLVAVDERSYGIAPFQPGMVYHAGRDVDWLAHGVTIWRVTGKRDAGNPSDPYAMQDEGESVKVQATFHGAHDWTLDNFVPYLYDEQSSETPGLCGGFDEHNQFHASCSGTEPAQLKTP